MFAPDRLSCFWPGLAKAWWRGSWTSLIAALLFGWGLCILMLATFIWPNWFSSWLVTSCWMGMLIFWVAECARSNWQYGRMQLDAMPASGDNRFSEAQKEYLRGNWFEAESLLHSILADAPRDAEAHLLLASVLRHSRRWAAAIRKLEQLELLDTSARWRFEIYRERQLILKRQREYEEQAEEQANSHSSTTTSNALA